MCVVEPHFSIDERHHSESLFVCNCDQSATATWIPGRSEARDSNSRGRRDGNESHFPMNECEMQIQLRQPAQAQPVLRSSGSSHTSTELNLSKQIQDSSSVTVAVQHLLESFDNSILRRTTTTCSNMSSEQARLAGIPSSLKTHQGALHHSSPSPTSSSVSSECNSPPTNGQGAAPLNGSGSLAKTGVNGGRLQFFKGELLLV